MSFDDAFKDRVLIRERMSTYADTMFQQDLAGWLANFTENCVWRGKGLEYRGHAQLATSWPLLWEPLLKMGYFTEVAAIELHGDRASARCYSHQIMFRKDGGANKLVGLYHDQLVRSNGTWLFELREFEFIGRETIAPPA